VFKFRAQRAAYARLSPSFLQPALLALFFLPLLKTCNNMKTINSLMLASLALVLTSCEAIGDIFGAGVYTGIFMAIFVVVLIVVVISRIFRR
jgi:hypothetical protein